MKVNTPYNYGTRTSVRASTQKYRLLGSLLAQASSMEECHDGYKGREQSTG
jgi:hypothetical protein